MFETKKLCCFKITPLLKILAHYDLVGIVVVVTILSHMYL